MKRIKWRRLLWLCMSAALVVLDQGTKLWARKVLNPIQTMPILPGLIGFRYAENRGAAFSAFSGATAALCAVTLLLCLALAAWLLCGKNGKLLSAGLAAALAGGVGNLIDRIGYGFVTDFLEVQFVRFAIFNGADVCITVGTGLIFIALMRHGGSTSHERMDGRG